MISSGTWCHNLNNAQSQKICTLYNCGDNSWMCYTIEAQQICKSSVHFPMRTLIILQWKQYRTNIWSKMLNAFRFGLASLTPPLFSMEPGKWVVMYECVKCIDFASFNDFPNEFWSCCDSGIFVPILLQFYLIWTNRIWWHIVRVTFVSTDIYLKK